MGAGARGGEEGRPWCCGLPLAPADDEPMRSILAEKTALQLMYNKYTVPYCPIPTLSKCVPYGIRLLRLHGVRTVVQAAEQDTRWRCSLTHIPTLPAAAWRDDGSMKMAVPRLHGMLH